MGNLYFSEKTMFAGWYIKAQAIYRLLFLLFLPCSSVIAQGIVPNGSFEDNISCPSLSNSSGINLCKDWYSPTKYPGFYFDSCDNIEGTKAYGIPQNVRGMQDTFRGHSYAGILAWSFSPLKPKTYIAAKISPLQKDSWYEVSAWFSLADSSSRTVENLGVYFFKNAVIDTNADSLVLTPQAAFGDNNLSIKEKNLWHNYKSTFKADSSYDHLILGGFFRPDHITVKVNPVSAGQAYSYYYVDSVSIKQVGVGIESISKFRDVDVFPNPSKGIFVFHGFFEGIEDISFSITDVLGKNLYTGRQTISNGELNKTIDLSNCTPGIYWLNCYVDEERVSRKIVIMP